MIEKGETKITKKILNMINDSFIHLLTKDLDYFKQSKSIYIEISIIGMSINNHYFC